MKIFLSLLGRCRRESSKLFLFISIDCLDNPYFSQEVEIIFLDLVLLEGSSLDLAAVLVLSCPCEVFYGCQLPGTGVSASLIN